MKQTEQDQAFKMVMDTVVNSAGVIDLLRKPLTDLIEQESRSHSILHITDPTLYNAMINSETFATNLRVAKAAIAFANEVKAAAENQLAAKMREVK